MASNQSTVDYVAEQAAAAGAVTARKMFGEYGLYCDGTLVGLICDDQLFIKPTEAGRPLIGDVVEASPYPGAKPSLLIDADRWDDREFLSDLVRQTAAGLPVPKSRTPRSTATARKLKS